MIFFVTKIIDRGKYYTWEIEIKTEKCPTTPGLPYSGEPPYYLTFQSKTTRDSFRFSYIPSWNFLTLFVDLRMTSPRSQYFHDPS